jgi:hypothetical protein
MFPLTAAAGQQFGSELGDAGCAGWQSTPVVDIFKQCDVESKKNVELSGKVGLRMVCVAQLLQQLLPSSTSATLTQFSILQHPILLLPAG